ILLLDETGLKISTLQAACDKGAEIGGGSAPWPALETLHQSPHCLAICHTRAHAQLRIRRALVQAPRQGAAGQQAQSNDSAHCKFLCSSWQPHKCLHAPAPTRKRVRLPALSLLLPSSSACRPSCSSFARRFSAAA